MTSGIHFTSSSTPFLGESGSSNRFGAVDTQISPDDLALAAQRVSPYASDDQESTSFDSPTDRENSTSLDSPHAGHSRRQSGYTISSIELPSVLEPVAGLHKWNGRVLEVDDGIFTAELAPLYHNGPTVLADFELSQLDIDEDESIQPGDLFYLSIATIRERGNRSRKDSLLLFRRLGSWAGRELEQIKREAQVEYNDLEGHIE
jgi:hypothetical protein